MKPRKKLTILFLLMVLAFILLAACTPAVVSSYNVDHDTDFKQYHTYAWDVPLNKAADESYNPLVNNSLVNKQVKEAIENEMASRGYKLVERNPDLLVNFHTMVESKSKVSSYPNNYYFWWRNEIQTTNYKEGTLIIDLIDAGKDQLVWQGYATNELQRQDLAKSLEAAVKHIYDKFPYRAMGGDVVSRRN